MNYMLTNFKTVRMKAILNRAFVLIAVLTLFSGVTFGQKVAQSNGADLSSLKISLKESEIAIQQILSANPNDQTALRAQKYFIMLSTQSEFDRLTPETREMMIREFNAVLTDVSFVSDQMNSGVNYKEANMKLDRQKSANSASQKATNEQDPGTPSLMAAPQN